MEGKMKAAIFVNDGDLQVKQVDIPGIKNAKDVLIQVEGCSICGSDVSVVSVPRRHPATPGTIIGHEYMGTIVEMGEDVTDFRIGERVIVEPNISCGKCSMCKKGHTNMCENMVLTGFHFNGGMAEYSVMPETQLHKMNQEMPMEKACLAEPLACIANSLTKFNIVPGDYCVVLGAGPIGLIYIELMKAAGASKVIVSECMEFRKETAASMGAMVVDPRESDLADFVKNVTNGEMADVVVDCVGGLMKDAMSVAAPGGQIVLFGLNMNAENTIKPFDLSHHEITTIGSYVVKDSFPRAIRILEEDVIDVAPIVTHVFPLERIYDGFKAIADGEALKVIIKMTE